MSVPQPQVGASLPSGGIPGLTGDTPISSQDHEKVSVKSHGLNINHTFCIFQCLRDKVVFIANLSSLITSQNGFCLQFSCATSRYFNLCQYSKCNYSA